MSYAPIFGQIKGLIEIHKRGNFHHCSICRCEVIYLQRFSEQQKVGFLAPSEWFFKDYSPKWSWICTKFSPVMYCKVMHHIYYGFLQNVKNPKKFSQKTEFQAHFWKFFDSTLLRPFSCTPIFLEMKGLMEMYNRDKFHLYSISGCQVVKLQIFSWW